jgi:hypothetical protein
MKHKVAELQGTLLDQAVAKAEGWKQREGIWFAPGRMGNQEVEWTMGGLAGWSTSWALGGPLIERKRIRLDGRPDSSDDGQWTADGYWGPTALVAAMRAYCALHFGATVELD